MLGWFGLDGAANGEADRVLARLVAMLRTEGMALAGAMQLNTDRGADCACDMDIVIIGEEDAPIRISQSLGVGSNGCRLDSGALEMAAARVGQNMTGAGLLIVPKFGRQEAEGRGFRSVIAQAVGDGLPVLLHVPVQQRAAFDIFADGMAEQITPDALALWCRRMARAA